MLDPDQLTPLIESLLTSSRWFGGKGRSFDVTEIELLGTLTASDGSPDGSSDGSLDGSPDDTPDPVVEVLVATVEYADGPAERYQVPISSYAEPQERLSHAQLGLVDGRWAYDALHDREGMAHYLRAFAAEETIGELTFHRVPGHELATDVHSTLFSGEQSNSSVMFGDDSLFKLFRKVTSGPNPDITVHEILTRAGSDHVAALYGWLEWTPGGLETPLVPRGSLTTERMPTESVHLGMLQQFLRTASDGWDLALASVRNLFAEADLHADEVGGDFAGEAARLGEALGEVHRTLAEHFPTRPRDRDELSALAAAMSERLIAAIEVEPALAEHVEKLQAAYDAVAALDGDIVQQIHGDLHLGQTLRTVKGWKIVDFEGEPAKPLVERLLPDSAWRDVAGMLRSLSYAPRVSALPLRSAEGADQREFRAHEWSARNREAFINAYAGRSLTVAEQTLLDAYLADKAVYEVVYEARNRPAWVPIPLEAIARIGADR